MRTYHANEIGNVAVLGHSGCGKTSIVDRAPWRANKKRFKMNLEGFGKVGASRGDDRQDGKHRMITLGRSEILNGIKP